MSEPTRKVQIIVDIELPERIGRETMANEIEEFVRQYAAPFGGRPLSVTAVTAWWTKEPVE